VIIVDTSVLISFLRGHDTAAVRYLEQLEAQQIPFAIPAICCMELLQGSRDQQEWDLLHEHLSTQQLVFPLDPWASMVEAARIFFDCRRKGLTVRSSNDCLIAMMTLEKDATLLHDDEDFERIRQVRPLKTLRG